MPRKQRKTSHSDVIKLLESRTLAFFTAMNTRNFDISLTPWTYLAPSFSCTLSLAGTAHLIAPIDISNNWKTWCAAHPAYRMHVPPDGFHTKIDQQGHFAEVWATFITTGEIEGVAKEIAGKWVWIKGQDGEWLITLMQCMVGVDGNVPV